MTYREKCLKEAEDELRKSGQLKDGETLETYNQRLLDEAHEDYLRHVGGEPKNVLTREVLLENTWRKIHEAYQDPNTGSVDVDPRLMKELFGSEVIQDG